MHRCNLRGTNGMINNKSGDLLIYLLMYLCACNFGDYLCIGDSYTKFQKSQMCNCNQRAAQKTEIFITCSCIYLPVRDTCIISKHPVSENCMCLVNRGLKKITSSRRITRLAANAQNCSCPFVCAPFVRTAIVSLHRSFHPKDRSPDRLNMGTNEQSEWDTPEGNCRLNASVITLIAPVGLRTRHRPAAPRFPRAL